MSTIPDEKDPSCTEESTLLDDVPVSSTKRTTKPEEDNWVCGVCTFHCTAEDMKCIACDARKGTSTRISRKNWHLIEDQLPLFHQKKKKRIKVRVMKGSSSRKSKKRWPIIKNVDRSNPQSLAVTVNNVTVIVTEFLEQMSDVTEWTSPPMLP